MEAIEIARKFAELNQSQDAQQAYGVVLQQKGLTPEEELEAASYIFFSQGAYQVAYTSFVSLYNRGQFQEQLLELMLQAFYLLNVEEQREMYERNCELLTKYPYFFRNDFPDFDQLPIRFFPYDDHSFIPFEAEKNHFGAYVDFNHPVIDRYFFRNLDDPILADDVFSQYHLEYLNDNVRKSEWVGRENHIYLHYTNWCKFCSYLQVLDFKLLLRSEKFVFLIEDEVSQYPIDFKERFGVDYSKYPVKPVGIREVNRLIWHAQLSTHNGGDFFNEIFYDHPNLLIIDSIILDKLEEVIHASRETLKQRTKVQTGTQRQLLKIKNPTDKDLLVALFMGSKISSKAVDPQSRIVPALFCQPHFHSINYNIKGSEEKGWCILTCDQYDAIQRSPLFQGFKYIKTFTPMRRVTTSYGASIRFASQSAAESEKIAVVGDEVSSRVLNRSFMVDWQDRLYKDSVLVRFEDGKLNPKATFTALAEFLDLPYTESMTYCSGRTGLNPESMAGNDLGFSTGAIYRTYEEYTNDADRAFVEYFLRDAYEYYGYDFHYWKGEEVDKAWIEEKARGAEHLDALIKESYERAGRKKLEQRLGKEKTETLQKVNVNADGELEWLQENRIKIGKTLLQGLHFVNKSGQPLQFMTPLKLDPALLEQPLYH